jgi:hypothetical protein
MINAHGWAVQTHHNPISGHLAYTVGVFALGGPEVLIRGVEPSQARTVLNVVAPTLITGQMNPGDYVAVPHMDGAQGERLALLRHVEDPTAAPVARALYGAGVPVIEVLLDPDAAQ